MISAEFIWKSNHCWSSCFKKLCWTMLSRFNFWEFKAVKVSMITPSGSLSFFASIQGHLYFKWHIWVLWESLSSGQTIISIEILFIMAIPSITFIFFFFFLSLEVMWFLSNFCFLSLNLSFGLESLFHKDVEIEIVKILTCCAITWL